jgi:ribosomal protein S18 acetylase RimI-like enzyme
MKIHCRRMTKSHRKDAERLLGSFLGNDPHYLIASAAYGDQGPEALRRALALFLRRKNLGFVWLAYAGGEPVGACVVSYAISTSIGGLVAKLDDVCVLPQFQRRGVATEMLQVLIKELKRQNVGRIDTSVHKRNRDAARYYKKMGFRPLGEDRLARLLRGNGG